MHQVIDKISPYVLSAAPPLKNNNKSEMFCQLVTSHLGLILVYCFGIPLPFQLSTVTTLSVCAQLLVWTDTAGSGEAARAARSHLRNSIAQLLSFIHLLILAYFSSMPKYVRPVIILATCVVCAAYAATTIFDDDAAKVTSSHLPVSRAMRRTLLNQQCDLASLFFGSRNKSDKIVVGSYENLREVCRSRPTGE